MNATKFFQKKLTFVLILFFFTVVIQKEEMATVFCCYISYLLFFPYIYKHRGSVPKNIIGVAALMSVMLFSSSFYNSTSIIYPIKFTSYILLFVFGYIAGKEQLSIYINDKVFALLTIIIVGYFVVTHTPSGGGFFALKNTYVYFGLILSLLYYCSHLKTSKLARNTIVILCLFVLSATNLGIVAAICTGYGLYSLNSPRKILGTCLLFCILLVVVNYVDIPLFCRIRSVYTLASSIPLSEFSDIQNITVFELVNKYGNGSEEGDSSFLFRLVHWTKILISLINSNLTNIFLGHGDMSVKDTFGLQSHNEYVKIIYENGVILFVCFAIFVCYVFKAIKPLSLRYIIISPFVYFFTENLLLFSFCNFFSFLLIGYLVGISNRLLYESC